MMWLLPVVLALFWLTYYRKTMAMPPLWSLRAASLQTGAVPVFAAPVAGAAAWMGPGRPAVTSLTWSRSPPGRGGPGSSPPGRPPAAWAIVGYLSAWPRCTG